MATTVKQRDQTLDILKGIGIILMVLGHSGVPFQNFIYLFHMALFFIASGYVWNDKKVADIPSLWRSILARLRGLWLPFALANGIFTLLTPVLVGLGLYGPEKALSAQQLILQFLKNLTMRGDTQMGGASWFLRTMLFVSIAHLLIRYITTHWKFGSIFFGAVILVTFAGAEFFNLVPLELPMGIHTCFCGYAALLLGMLIRKLAPTEKLGKYLPLASLGSFIVLLILNPIDNIGMGAGNISSLPFFIAASLCGWILVWGVATLLNGPVGNAISYCGRNSVWIVMLHFLAFKPVAFVYLKLTGLSMTGLSSFPIYPASWLWVAYGLSGTLLPLALCACVYWLRSLINKKT